MPPSGFFTTVNLNSAGNTLTYAGGSQASGTTSSWGSGIVDYDNTGSPIDSSPDNLIIDASGGGFDLKEIPASPARRWKCCATSQPRLGRALPASPDLALFGVARKLTKRSGSIACNKGKLNCKAHGGGRTMS